MNLGDSGGICPFAEFEVVAAEAGRKRAGKVERHRIGLKIG